MSAFILGNQLLSLAWMYCWIWDVTEPECERQKRNLAHSYLTSLPAGCPRRKEREQRGRERLTDMESTGDQIPPGRTRVCRHAFLATEVARNICQRVYTQPFCTPRHRECTVHQTGHVLSTSQKPILVSVQCVLLL